MEELKAYKSIYYNHRSKNFKVKFVDSTDFVDVEFKDFFYVQDNSGKYNEYHDIYGNSFRKIYVENKDTIENYKRRGDIVAETDIKPIIKFLSYKFGHTQFIAEPEKFRQAFMDIETDCIKAVNFDPKFMVEIRKDANSEPFKVTIKEYERVYDKQHYHIKHFDLDIWYEDYKDSCYITNEFPYSYYAKYPVNAIGTYSTVDDSMHIFTTLDYTGKYLRDLTPEEIDEVTEGGKYKRWTKKIEYHHCNDEAELLSEYIHWFVRQKFDILIDWNGDDFDIPYLCNRTQILEEEGKIREGTWLKFSPFNKINAKDRNEYAEEKFDDDLDELFEKEEGEEEEYTSTMWKKRGKFYEIEGLNHMDYMVAYKTYWSLNHKATLESASLNNCAAIEGVGHKDDLEGQVTSIHRTDGNRFIDYLIQDCYLVHLIDEKCKYIQFNIQYAYDSLVTLDMVYSMVITTEGYMFRDLHNKNMVVHDVKPMSEQVDWWRDRKYYIVKNPDGTITYQNCKTDKNMTSFPPFDIKAGFCFARAGIYKWVISGDITSSYPHQIMMYNMSPETLVCDPPRRQIEEEDLIPSEISHVYFKRTENAVLPTTIATLFAERKEYKKKEKNASNDIEKYFFHGRQMGKKRAINSMYGVCLYKTFHFYSIDLARSITRCARHCIRYLIEKTNQYYISTQFIQDIKDNLPNMWVTFTDGSRYVYRDTHEVTARIEDEVAQVEIGQMIEGVEVMVPTRIGTFKKFDWNEYDMVYKTIAKIEYIDFDKVEHLVSECVVQSDTDSSYCCFDEMMELFYNEVSTKDVINGSRIIIPFKNMIEKYWVKVLQEKADVHHQKQMINFECENMFNSFFSFGKKMYVGGVIYKEGEFYFEPGKEYHKITGIPITRSDMPDFCKKASENIVFDIAGGLSKEDTYEKFRQVYSQFQNATIEDISGKKSVSEYTKFFTKPIKHYLTNGLPKLDHSGVIFGAKCSFYYNFVMAKYKLPLTPIGNGTRFKYIYVKENNLLRCKAIAYIGNYPQFFHKLFEIDKETMFRKGFLPIFQRMAAILKWIPKKDVPIIFLKDDELEDLFE